MVGPQPWKWFHWCAKVPLNARVRDHYGIFEIAEGHSIDLVSYLGREIRKKTQKILQAMLFEHIAWISSFLYNPKVQTILLKQRNTMNIVEIRHSKRYLWER